MIICSSTFRSGCGHVEEYDSNKRQRTNVNILENQEQDDQNNHVPKRIFGRFLVGNLVRDMVSQK